MRRASLTEYRNLEWVKFMLESVGLDMSQKRFRELAHLFMYLVCKADRDMRMRKAVYSQIEIDKEILRTLFSSKEGELMLKERDESYGNTPLHIACSLHSIDFTRFMIEVGSDLTIKNLAEKTPEEVVDSEIENYSKHLHSEERDMILERLVQVKTVFRTKKTGE